jgi:heat shock protein HslJ
MIGVTRISSFFALALFAAACGASGGDTTAPPAGGGITGIDWQMQTLSLDGNQVGLAGTTPTISFEDKGDAGGSNGCNSYGGSYATTADGGISFGPMFQTEIGCQPDVAAVEQAFMTAIGRVDRWSIAAETLTLAASDGSAELVFGVPAPIVNSPLIGSWLLDTIGDAVAVSSIIADTDPTLDITEDGISGSAGCNRYFGGLTFDADGTFVTGNLGSTKMACEQGVMRQEQQILDILSNAARYEIEGDKLLISTDDGGDFLRYTAAE